MGCKQKENMKTKNSQEILKTMRNRGDQNCLKKRLRWLTKSARYDLVRFKNVLK